MSRTTRPRAAGPFSCIGRAHDAELRVVETVDHEETVEVDDTRVLWRLGPVGQDASVVELRTDGFHAWSSAGSVAGSYSLFGGRALAGTLQHVGREVRERRRDVVSLDGEERAVVRQWFRGSKRLGVEHGVLRFEAR